jgi:hypothetical protein
LNRLKVFETQLGLTQLFCRKGRGGVFLFFLLFLPSSALLINPSITTAQTIRIQPDYFEEVITFDFSTDDEYDHWFTNVASKQVTFRLKTTYTPQARLANRPLVCHHFVRYYACTPKKKSNNTPDSK